MKQNKPDLAIAYSVKRKKKMAEGGSISASNEKRPMPDDKHDDAKMASQNSNIKPAKEDSMTSQPERRQAGMGKTFPLKRPKMVPTNSFSTRMMDEEDHLMKSDAPAAYDAQPPKHDDEEGPDLQGPQVPDMADEHSNGRKPYAKGGMAEYGDRLEYDALEHPAHLEEDDDQMSPSEDEFMANHFAEGGTASNPASRLDAGYGKVIMKARGGQVSPDDEIQDEDHSSVAAAIMAKRKMMAEGGDVIGSHDSIFTFPKASQADLSRNADEDANEEDQLSFNALRKENYDESDALDQLDQPEDSNLKHVEPADEDDHDRVSAIRKRMKMRR